MIEIRVSIDIYVSEMTNLIELAGGGKVLKTDDNIVYGHNWAIVTEYSETGPYSHIVKFFNNTELATMFSLRFG